jgi:hypothetical protein
MVFGCVVGVWKGVDRDSDDGLYVNCFSLVSHIISGLMCMLPVLIDDVRFPKCPIAAAEFDKWKRARAVRRDISIASEVFGGLGVLRYVETLPCAMGVTC